MIIIQLNKSNFLLQKFHIETAVNGYGLEALIYITTSTPTKFIEDSEGKIINKKEFIKHLRQDILLSSWLLS